MTELAANYYARRGVSPGPREAAPEPEHEPRRREPTAAERANAPVPVTLAGYDPQRMQSSQYWATGREYEWLMP